MTSFKSTKKLRTAQPKTFKLHKWYIISLKKKWAKKKVFKKELD